jgi:hypothetical protein
MRERDRERERERERERKHKFMCIYINWKVDFFMCTHEHT